ncbi:ABC exporter membrane fusion protein [Oscillatoria sp. FACHB-1407]|uniref:ABC exporter membrane fusion protein n=1 Tax=Oscillatoria sp. FACHB-1407 TaxID=2692847 RepID=UPI001682382E|nr:ABC exporter membrane fusion protein [Oscillatoria sp. FACHB-1407]MBD2464428.1 ABC exporter membrane fusion protein [Oscillatoria sp. FACHB-1407]
MKPDLISGNKPLLKPSGRWVIAVTVVAALAVSGATIQYVFRAQPAPSQANTELEVPTAEAVSALGRLEPEGEVIYLSAPTALNGLGTSRVAQLLVKQGDVVKAGQVVAVLDNVNQLQAALKLAQEEVNVAQADLAQVEAGAQTGEVEAQKATIARLKAELDGQLNTQDQIIARLEAELGNSQTEYQRYRELYRNGAVTASQLDSKEVTMTTTREQLNEAKANRSRMAATIQEQIREAQATLDRIMEVRPTDIQVAQAELNKAIANVNKARAELELAYIRSPQDGQILGVYTRPGEVVGDQGVVALGQTDQMVVIAEVYESDVGRLQVGQKATISSNAFSGELQGTITQIGLQINAQDILSVDPTANVDSRVVEVKIQLDAADSQRVSAFTNLQVNVVIDL